MATKQEPMFKERKDGILEYCGSTEPEIVAEAWDNLDSAIDMDIWSQASIAAAIIPKWQKESVKKFAEQVEKSFQYVYKMSKTYKYYTNPENSPRVEKLTFKHHTLALRHPNPHAALLHAREKGMSTVKFEEWLVNEINTGKAGGRSAMSEIELSELRAYLEHVEEIIQTDLIENCPDKGFASRVFGAWLREVREENKQLYISDVRELVRTAIEFRAARTIQEIVKVTGIRKNEVESAVIWLVQEQEEYEWVEQGGETDEARGTNSWILHKTGERDGSAYSSPRPVSQYSN